MCIMMVVVGVKKKYEWKGETCIHINTSLLAFGALYDKKST